MAGLKTTDFDENVTPTWKAENTSFDEMLHSMFENNNSSEKLYVDGWKSNYEVNTKGVFINPYGFCRYAENIQATDQIWVTASKPVRLIMIDPIENLKITVLSKDYNQVQVKA